MDNELLLYRLENATNKALEVHAELSYSLGKYYGYPKCCIEEFCSDLLNYRYDNITSRNINTEGFVPCRKHFVDIQLKLVNIEDLISNRVCTEPYHTLSISSKK